MEPQPRMVPRWISGQAPRDVGQTDFARDQMVSDWPCGQSSRMCSRVSVVPLQFGQAAGGTVFEVGDALPEVADSEGAM